jgi:hypothetical protein
VLDKNIRDVVFNGFLFNIQPEGNFLIDQPQSGGYLIFAAISLWPITTASEQTSDR